MKKYLDIFLLVFFINNALAYTYDSDISNLASFDYGEITINNGVTVSPPSGDNIIINYPPVYLYNYGTIDGCIDTNNNNLFVYNTGTISGGITTVNGGNVRQIIRSLPEITDINVIGGNYVIEINGYQNLDFNSIKNLNSDSFVFNNSSVIINNFTDWQNWGKTVRLQGSEGVRLVINDIGNAESGVFINNVNPDDEELLTIQITDTDHLHAVHVEREGSRLVLYFVRTTDYNLIYNDTATEKIRKNNPNDKLILALDKANDENTINNIKNNSYRYNHGILLRPIKAINNFSVFDEIQNNSDSGVGIRASYMFSDDVKNLGGRIYVGENYNDLYFNVGLNFNSFSYEDELNDFSGVSYGFDINARQSFSKLWLKEIAGISLVKYNADYITADNELKNNPFGTSGYAEIDFGYDFDIESDLILSPFVGGAYQKYKVADISDNDVFMRGGTNIKYSFITDGIKYEYALTGSVATNSDLSTTIKFGFTSVTDMVGASLDAGVFKNDVDVYYRFSVNAKVLF